MRCSSIGIVLACLALGACGGSPAAPSSKSRQSSPTRIIALTGNLAFGNVELGRIVTAPLTITNDGNAPLTISGLALNVSGFSSPSAAGFTASMHDTIPAGESRTATITFEPKALRSYQGLLTVDADQTGGTNSVEFSGAGIPGMFSAYSTCPNAVKPGTAVINACYVLVDPRGTDSTNMNVTSDLRLFGLAQTCNLARCMGCGEPVEWTIDLHIPADMPAGPIPLTFTITDGRGRTATTTADLTVIR